MYFGHFGFEQCHEEFGLQFSNKQKRVELFVLKYCSNKTICYACGIQ